MDKIKVAYFTRYIPHYRKDVFEEIGKNKDILFHVYASYKYKGGFSLIDPTDTVNFKLIDSKIYKIPFLFFSVYYQHELITNLIKNKYDIYIASLSKSNISVWFALILAKIFKRKIILWGHGSFKNRLNYFAMRLMINLSTAILFYDESTKALWIEKGIKKNKLFTAYNTVNTNSISKVISKTSRESIENFKVKYKIHNSNNILFIGRLQKRRNLEVLFSAMEYIKKKKYNIKLLIVGDGPEKQVLQRLKNEKNLDDYIAFLGAIYNEHEIAKVFLSSICTIVPGWVGLIVQHSFCYGLPIIIGNNPAYHGPEASLVTDKETGLICDYNNPEDFANAIIKINNDIEFRKFLSENAKRLITLKYNANNMALGFIKAIQYAKFN